MTDPQAGVEQVLTAPASEPALPASEPPVPTAIRELPLGAGRLIPVSFDLLWRAEAPIRHASFYIGFLLLATVGPAVALFAAAALTFGGAVFDPFTGSDEWSVWLSITLLVAGAGFFVASVEARLIATAVIAATLEGRDLTMGGLLALARRRFWTAARAAFLIGIPILVGQNAGEALARAIAGPSAEVAFIGNIVGGVLFGTPFVYALSGVVLGEVGAGESVRRSWRLFGARPRLAVVVTTFSLASQFVLLFAISAGADITIRVLEALGIGDGIPVLAGVLASAVLVFALGTLVFLAEALAATPAVHAFVALTHYTRGLAAGRQPADEARGRRAWITRPLVVGTMLGVAAMVAGLASLGV